MGGRNFYIGARQLTKLKAEAETLGIDISKLIDLKLRQFPLQQSPSVDSEAVEKLQEAFLQLATRVQNLELILKQYCALNEAELADLGFLRGAIEVQASRSKEATEAAQQTEQQRLELSKQVKAEIDKYLN